MMRFARSACLAFVCAFLAAGARADATDDLVQKEMAARRIPGLSLAVIRDGKVVKAQGYGFANLELRVPASRATLYQSGSLGKTFTAAAVMRLVEAGKVELDAPVARYFPEAPPAWSKATVGQFLNHTSGMPRDYEAPEPRLRVDMRDEEVVKAVFALDPMMAPGFMTSYSNAGYELLGFLIQRVSGKTYGDFLREAFFEPFGMVTARIVEEAPIIPDRAAGYEILDGELRNQRWVAPTYNRTAAGALYFSIDDLIRWNAALDQGRVLGEESMKLAWSPVKTGSGSLSNYGLGWALDGFTGHARVHHPGGWQGFSTSMQRYPDDRVAVIVLTNLGPPHARPGEIAEAVAKLHFPRGQ